MTPTTSANALPVKPGQKPAPLSAVAEAIKTRADERPVEVFDVTGFFGPGDRVIPRIGFRAPTSWEQLCALAESHKFSEMLAGASDGAKNDRDILEHAKAAHIAYECCREVKETEPGSGIYAPTGNPAFPGPKWMCEKMEPERIAVLLNYVLEVRARHAPSPVTIDDGTVEAYVSLCSTADEPEYGLVGCSREYLVQLLILASHKLARERAAAAAQAPAPAESA